MKSINLQKSVGQIAPFSRVMRFWARGEELWRHKVEEC